MPFFFLRFVPTLRFGDLLKALYKKPVFVERPRSNTQVPSSIAERFSPAVANQDPMVRKELFRERGSIWPIIWKAAEDEVCIGPKYMHIRDLCEF
ncbi:hypothetical protein GCM10010869_35070 [Mesorhizobium tianshanense]|nr:hypothetical protein GCM10010869_35070 [Mesorhizobium tianshanense]